jgi:hypothetical protein
VEVPNIELLLVKDAPRLGVRVAFVRRLPVRVGWVVGRLSRWFFHPFLRQTSLPYRGFQHASFSIRVISTTEARLVGAECAEGYNYTFVLKPIANAGQALTISQRCFNLGPHRSDLTGLCKRFFFAPRCEAVSGLGNPFPHLVIGIIWPSTHCSRQSVLLGASTIKGTARGFSDKKVGGNLLKSAGYGTRRHFCWMSA